ncbi:MAG: hypothetical protein V4700_02475 [Pseudomonadota bacterium]
MNSKISATPIGNHQVNIGLAIIGMLIIIAGTLITPLQPQKLCYLTGGLFLLLSAILERQLFFTLLQLIISSGTLIAFAPLTSFYKALVPICLSIIVIVYFIKTGKLHNPLNRLGCLGLIFLGIGYAITHPLIYFLGGVCLTLFSFAAFRQGVRLGLVWGLLNAVFTVTAGIATYKFFF